MSETGTTFLGIVGHDLGIAEVMRMVFYFDRPRQKVGRSAETAIRAFAEIVTPEAFEVYFGLDGEQQRATRSSFEQEIWNWFSGPYSVWPNASIRFGRLEVEAPKFGFTYWGKMLGDPSYPDNRGFLDAWVPPTFYLEHTAALDNFFTATTAANGVCSAWWDIALSGGNQLAKQALGARYAGLDISRPKSVSLDLGNKVPGAHWVTSLNPDQLQVLGGRAALEAKLPKWVQIFRLENDALIIRLAKHPQLGDRNRREDLPSYRWLADLLESNELLHVPRAGHYFLGRNELPDLNAQEAWHRRFLAEL